MIVWLWLSVVIAILDQVSKYYMSQILTLCEPGNCSSLVMLPVFKFTLLHNEGAAFSFLSDAGGWQRWVLVFVSTAVSAVLIVWIARLKSDEKWLALTLSLILGGAVGNLIDRVQLGYVVDFIVVHYENSYFPAFNVADSAITVGGAFMILDILFFSRHSSAAKPGDEDVDRGG
jgi:signal peptidase II